MHDFENERLVLRIVFYFFWLIIHVIAALLKIMVTFFFSVPTPTKEVIVPVGMTKRQCACKMALKLSSSGSSSAYACDPHLQQNYLICQDDGTFESKSCPAGEAWNYMEKTCSDKMRKCRPIPAACAAL